jgi:hypothetical protein
VLACVRINTYDYDHYVYIFDEYSSCAEVEVQVQCVQHRRSTVHALPFKLRDSQDVEIMSEEDRANQSHGILNTDLESSCKAVRECFDC